MTCRCASRSPAGTATWSRWCSPLQLARFALPLLDLPHAAVLGEHGVDINRIREALRSGEPCDILDYQDEESGHRIQIVIA